MQFLKPSKIDPAPEILSTTFPHFVWILKLQNNAQNNVDNNTQMDCKHIQDDQKGSPVPSRSVSSSSSSTATVTLPSSCSFTSEENEDQATSNGG